VFRNVVKAILAILASTLGALVQMPAAAEPAGLVSEIITIRYAKASDVAAVLNFLHKQDLTPAGVTRNPPDAKLLERADVSNEPPLVGELKIISDERMNALLVVTSPGNIKRIKEIVSRVDVVLAQVLIEAVVLEMPLRGLKIPFISQTRIQ